MSWNQFDWQWEHTISALLSDLGRRTGIESGARTADGLHRERLLEWDRLGRVADVDDEFAGIDAPVLCIHVVVAEGAFVQVQDNVPCLTGIEADFAELLELHQGSLHLRTGVSDANMINVRSGPRACVLEGKTVLHLRDG